MGVLTSMTTEQAVAAACYAIVRYEFMNEQDPKFKFARDIHVDNGSRSRIKDFYYEALRTISGEIYDTPADGSLLPSKDFNKMSYQTRGLALAPKTVHFTIPRIDIDSFNNIYHLTDPNQNPEGFIKKFKQKWGDMVIQDMYEEIRDHRRKLVDYFFDSLLTLTRYSEKIIKASGDVTAATDIWPFVNQVTTAFGETALETILKHLRIQLNNKKHEIGAQKLKYLAVGINNIIEATKLASPQDLVNNQFRNAGSPYAWTPFVWNTESGKENHYIAIAEKHSIKMIGRQEMSQPKSFDYNGGVAVAIDIFDIMDASNGQGIVYGNVS